MCVRIYSVRTLVGTIVPLTLYLPVWSATVCANSLDPHQARKLKFRLNFIIYFFQKILSLTLAQGVKQFPS